MKTRDVFMSRRIGIASDHAGYGLKMKMLDFLRASGYEVKDFGAHSAEASDYPDYAHPLALAVERGECELGVSICGAGNGINMTVNKHQGIRSALCWKAEIAELARKHNNANICALPARFINEDEAREIVRAFLDNSFEGGRHENRVNKIPYSC